MAALERDAAIARTRRTRRWMIAGAAALSAGIAALVSSIAPGRTLGAATANQPATSASGQARASVSSRAAEPKMPPLASPTDLGLQGPVQNPQPASNPSPPASQAAPAPDTVPAAPAPVSGGS